MSEMKGTDKHLQKTGDGRLDVFKHGSKRKSTCTLKNVPRENQDQDDELLALASIYDSDVFTASTDTYSGRYHANVILPMPFHIVIGESTTSEADIGCRKFEVNYLPSIVLSFRLPPNYPSTQKPLFRLSCNWLNKKQVRHLYMLRHIIHHITIVRSCSDVLQPSRPNLQVLCEYEVWAMNDCLQPS